MRYRKLAKTYLTVSAVCQGTWSVATRDIFWDGQDHDAGSNLARRA